MKSNEEIRLRKALEGCCATLEVSLDYGHFDQRPAFKRQVESDIAAAIAALGKPNTKGET